MAKAMIAPKRESMTPVIHNGPADAGLEDELAREATPEVGSGVGFVTTADGKIIGVILRGQAFEEYEEYLVDKGMAQAARESEGEAGRTLSEFIADLRADGEVDV